MGVATSVLTNQEPFLRRLFKELQHYSVQLERHNDRLIYEVRLSLPPPPSPSSPIHIATMTMKDAKYLNKYPSRGKREFVFTYHQILHSVSDSSTCLDFWDHDMGQTPNTFESASTFIYWEKQIGYTIQTDTCTKRREWGTLLLRTNRYTLSLGEQIENHAGKKNK